MARHHKSLRRSRTAVLLIVLTMLLTLLLGAGSVGAQPTSAEGVIISPEVAADGTVTFRRYVRRDRRCDLPGCRSTVNGRSPRATFSARPGPHRTWSRTANGVWTYSIQLEPNYYNYRFYVWRGPTTANRVQVHDPLNPPWDPTGINSQVFVPGARRASG